MIGLKLHLYLENLLGQEAIDKELLADALFIKEDLEKSIESLRYHTLGLFQAHLTSMRQRSCPSILNGRPHTLRRSFGRTMPPSFTAGRAKSSGTCLLGTWHVGFYARYLPTRLTQSSWR